MDKSQRPPEIQTAAAEEEADPPMERESSLLPGMLRTPSHLFALGRSVDWAAPGSSVWEEEDDGARPKTLSTPLTGYGRSSEAWASATGSPLLDGDTEKKGVTRDSTESSKEGKPARNTEAHQLQRREMVAALAAAALEALGTGPAPGTSAQNRVAVPVSSHPAPVATTTTATTASAAHHTTTTATATTTTTHNPYAAEPSYFTVESGSGGAGAQQSSAAGGATDGITVTEHHGHATPSLPARGPLPAGGPARPTLEDKQVAQSIIASAGLPLSMSSLLTYIKEGQPQFEEHGYDSANAAIYGATVANRNYPNLSDPPPQFPPPQQQQPPQQQMGGGYGYGGQGSGGGGGNYGYEQSGMNRQDYGGSGANANWTGVAETSNASGGGGWNVQANSPSVGPAMPSQPYNNSDNAGYGAQSRAAPYGYRGGRGGGGGGGFGADTGFHLPPAGYGQHLQQQHPQQQGPHQGHYGGHGNRAKSESEILSDLLHFHANFFPPPPPPRVPNEQKRNRAALWYHYASKWDITHRLPPPPRNPLPEMELEYIMQLPEMTRVPYHGDGWLNMSERWFAVTQSLFDFPDENVGVELDAAIVMDQAVTS